MKDNSQAEILRFMKIQQQERIEKISVLNKCVQKGQILFTGSSLMEQFPIGELLMTEKMPYVIYNRGVGGYTTKDMLMHMPEMVFDIRPSKIFINIGTNDIGSGDFRKEILLDNYSKILVGIQKELPRAVIYVMAYYPVNEVDKRPKGDWGKNAFVHRNNQTIGIINEELKLLAEQSGCRFINVNEGLADEAGRLKKEYTVEGIHMYANAYRVILHNMKKYIEEIV